jgi:hypothetical protein
MKAILLQRQRRGIEELQRMKGKRIWKLQAVDNVVVLIHLVAWRIVVTVSGCAEFCL